MAFVGLGASEVFLSSKFMNELKHKLSYHLTMVSVKRKSLIRFLGACLIYVV